MSVNGSAWTPTMPMDQPFLSHPNQTEYPLDRLEDEPVAAPALSVLRSTAFKDPSRRLLFNFLVDFEKARLITDFSKLPEAFEPAVRMSDNYWIDILEALKIARYSYNELSDFMKRWLHSGRKAVGADGSMNPVWVEFCAKQYHYRLFVEILTPFEAEIQAAAGFMDLCL